MVYLQKMVIFYSYVKLPEGINFSGNPSNQQLLTLVAKSQVWIFDNHNIFSNVSAIGAANWHFSSEWSFSSGLGVPLEYPISHHSPALFSHPLAVVPNENMPIWSFWVVHVLTFHNLQSFWLKKWLRWGECHKKCLYIAMHRSWHMLTWRSKTILLKL